MKTLLLLVMLLSITTSNASDYDCRVVELKNDSFFDTALQEYGNSDEDYTSVSIETKKEKIVMKVGGLSYPAKSTKIVSLEENAKTWVKVVNSEETEFSFVHDHTNGKAYLVEGEDLNKVIAYLNCYKNGFDPFQGPDLRF